MDPRTVAAVGDWPKPPSNVELFVGLCSYCRRFVDGYADEVACCPASMGRARPQGQACPPSEQENRTRLGVRQPTKTILPTLRLSSRIFQGAPCNQDYSKELGTTKTTRLDSANSGRKSISALRMQATGGRLERSGGVNGLPVGSCTQRSRPSCSSSSVTPCRRTRAPEGACPPGPSHPDMTRTDVPRRDMACSTRLREPVTCCDSAVLWPVNSGAEEDYKRRALPKAKQYKTMSLISH